MNDPVQSIASQVEVIYEKTLSEIEREETDLREQIDRLEKKRNILGKKRDHVHQLRSLVENLTQSIIEAEEICEQEEERKADLDVRIEKVSASLQRLQVEAKRAKTDHNQANKSKIEKYRALSKIVERFGDIKGRLPDSVLAGLEDATYGDTESSEATLLQRRSPKKPMLESVESLGITDLDLDEALDVYEEDIISDDDTILENSARTHSLQLGLEDSVMEDDGDLEDDPEFDEFEEELAKSESEDLSLDDDEYNFMNDEERESFIDLMSEDDSASSLQGVQGKSKRVPSSEEVRLREAIAPVQQEDDYDSESEIEETESTLTPTSDGEIDEEELAEETLETSSEETDND
ncbi:TPA: hypothetical protein DHW51_03310 [Candidatus Poribacteria bacterium]|nr:hypothetical protein [Candidatus Poribacteria bacterium]HCK13129.1 hypothetical protein [Candidatus Poribacteria bacterium]